jgi:hypothetical protein
VGFALEVDICVLVPYHCATLSQRDFRIFIAEIRSIYKYY